MWWYCLKAQLVSIPPIISYGAQNGGEGVEGKYPRLTSIIQRYYNTVNQEKVPLSKVVTNKDC